MKIKTKNLKDFKIATEKIFTKIKPNEKGATVVLLSGDLGAGKTTMTQIFGKILGVKKTIASPTFVIMRSYKLKTKDHRLLIHIDAYRLDSGKDIEKLGFKEIIKEPKNLILIEWPERIKKILPQNSYKIFIKHLEKGREISFNKTI